MRGSGRFGKYGDLKRKEKIRQNRLLQRDRAGNLTVTVLDRIKGPKAPKEGGRK